MTIGSLRWILPVFGALGLFAQKPVIQPGGVQNAASLLSLDQPPLVTPQMVVTIFGQNLAASPVAVRSTPWPPSLGGTTVTFQGIPAPLFYVSPTQINAQVPSGVKSLATADVVVTTAAGGASDPMTVLLGPEAYGIFTQDATGCGPGMVLNVHPDASMTMNTTQNSFDPNNDVGIRILMTGFGAFSDRQDGLPWFYIPADNVPGTAVIGIGAPAVGIQRTATPWQITYAGPSPGTIGVDEVAAIPHSTQPFPEVCRLPLYLANLQGRPGSSSQMVNMSIHSGGGACVDPPPDSLGLVTWQKSTTSDTNAVSSSEGVLFQLWKGNLLQFPAVPSVGTSCCTAQVQPPLSCTASLPATIGTGGLAITGVTANVLTISPQTQGGGTVYSASVPAGTLQGGNYAIASTGDDSNAIRPWNADATIPAPIRITTDLSPGTTLTFPLQLTWSGGDARSLVGVELRVANSPIQPYDFRQWASAADGSVTLPASVPSGAAEIIVTQQPATSPNQPFSIPGATMGGAHTWNYVWDFRALQH